MMKVLIVCVVAVLACVSAFVPSSNVARSGLRMQAQVSHFPNHLVSIAS